MGRDKIDVLNADANRFNCSLLPDNQQNDMAASDAPMQGEQNASVDQAQERSAAEAGGVVNAENRSGVTLQYSDDVNLEDFRRLVPAKLTKEDTVTFQDDVSDALMTKNRVIEEKGYVRFQHVSKTDRSLKLDQVKHWLWLPFVGVGFRTNLGEVNHNKAMRNTFHAMIQNKFGKAKVPGELLTLITGGVKDIVPEMAGRKDNNAGAQFNYISSKNKKAALQLNEVSKTFYRYNTVLNTTDARKQIFKETLLSAVRQTGKLKAMTLDSLPEELDRLGFEKPNDVNNLDQWIEKLSEKFGVDLSPKELTVGEDGKISATMDALEASANAFVGSVNSFAEKIEKELKIKQVNREITNTVELLMSNENLMENVGDLFHENVVSQLHEVLSTKLVYNLDDAAKKELGIDQMTDRDVAELVGYFCVGSRSSEGGKSPLTAALNALYKRLKVGNQQDNDQEALKNLKYDEYLWKQLQSFIKSYVSIKGQIEQAIAPNNGIADEDGQAKNLSAFCKTLETANADNLKTLNEKFGAAFPEAVPPLEHGKILKAVFMDRFCDYFSDERWKGQPKADSRLFLEINRADQNAILQNQTLGEAVAGINKETTSSSPQDISKAFFASVLDDTLGEQMTTWFAETYKEHIANQLADAVLERRQDQNVDVTVVKSSETETKTDFGVNNFVSEVRNKVSASVRGNKDIAEHEKAVQKDAKKDGRGFIQQAMAAWHKVSFAKNTFYLGKNAVGFKVGGLFTIANSVKNVGMSAWTLKTDIVNLFTDKQNADRAKISLDKQIQDSRKAIWQDAYLLGSPKSVISLLQEAMVNVSRNQMQSDIITSVTGKVKTSMTGKVEGGAETTEEAVTEEALKRPLKPAGGGEWINSNESATDMAESVIQLSQDVENEVKNLQKDPFTILGFRLPFFSLFDKEESQTGFENDLRKILATVDNKTMAASLGIPYGGGKMTEDEEKEQRRILVDLCVLRFSEAITNAMRDAVQKFSYEVAESYGKVHSAVIQGKPYESTVEYVRKPEQGRGYCLSESGKQRFQRVTMEAFAMAYQEQMELLARVVTGETELRKTDPQDTNMQTHKDILSRDRADLNYETLAKQAVTEFLTSKGLDPNKPGFEAEIRKLYPNTVMYYTTWDNAQFSMRSGFVKRLYNEAILKHLNAEGLNKLTLKQSETDTNPETYSAKVRTEFLTNAQKSIGEYLENTEKLMASAIGDAATNFFASAAAVGLSEEQSKSLQELQELVKKDSGTAYLQSLICKTFVTREATDEAMMSVNNARDRRIPTASADLFNKMLHSKKFVGDVLAKFKSDRDTWQKTLANVEADLPRRTGRGIELIGSIFAFVESQSNQAEAQKGTITKLFEQIKASFTGKAQETEWSRYMKQFDISDNQEGQEEQKLKMLKRFIGTNRPFQALIRKLVADEIDTNISPNMQKYVGNENKVFESALNNVAGKVYSFIPQFLDNWAQLSSYDKYLDVAMSPNGAGVRAVEQAAEEVSLKMFKAHENRSVEQGQESSLYRLTDDQLNDYSKTFAEIRDKLRTPKEYKVAEKRAELLSNDAIAGGLRTAVNTAVKGLITAVTGNKAAEGEPVGFDKELANHAIWVLATKIAARYTSLEEVAKLLAESEKADEEPNWLRELVNDVVTTIADSAKALSAKTFLADRGIDETQFAVRPKLADFKAKYPDPKCTPFRGVFPMFADPSAPPTGVTATKEFMEWIREETSQRFGAQGEKIAGEIIAQINADMKVVFDAEKKLEDDKFATIFASAIEAKFPPSVDDVLEKSKTELSNGFWTGVNGANVEGLHAALVQRCIADLDGMLVEGVEIADLDEKPVLPAALAEAATAYRAALLELVAKGLGITEKDLSTGMINRLKSEGREQIREALLAEIEREVQLPSESRLFTAYVNEIREQYVNDDVAKLKLTDKEKDAAKTKARADLTDEKVLDRFLARELTHPSQFSPLAALEATIKDRLAGDAVFDQIQFDYTKTVFALTYAKVIGGYNVATAAMNAKLSDELYYADEIQSAGRKLKHEFTDTDFAKVYSKHYPDTALMSFMVNLSKEITDAVLATGYEKDFFKYRLSSKKLQDARGKLAETIKGLVKKYEEGFPLEVRQRNALLTGFNGVRDFIHGDQKIANLIETIALKTTYMAWFSQNSKQFIGDSDMFALCDGLKDVIYAGTYADDPPKSKESQFIKLLNAVETAREKRSEFKHKHPDKFKAYLADKNEVAKADHMVYVAETNFESATKELNAAELNRQDAWRKQGDIEKEVSKVGATDPKVKKAKEDIQALVHQAEVRVQRAMQAKTDAEKALAARKREHTDLKNKLTDKYTANSFFALFGKSGFLDLEEKIDKALESFKDYVRNCRAGKDANGKPMHFTKSDLAAALKIIGEKQFKAYKEEMRDTLDTTLCAFVKTAHDPEKFFANKDWNENGLVFGLLPLKAMVDTKSAQSIFSVAKKVCEGRQEKSYDEQRKADVDLPEFLSFFTEKDQGITEASDKLYTFVASTLNESERKRIAEIKLKGNQQGATEATAQQN